MDMEFLYRPSLDAFFEWRSGVLVTPSRTIRLTGEHKQEASWFFLPPTLLITFEQADQAESE
jgi:hypothetical protein